MDNDVNMVINPQKPGDIVQSWIGEVCVSGQG